MRCINYKCNSCGGRVIYNKKHNNWRCEYCNLEYDTLYKNDKSRVEQPSKKITVHEYKCSKCHSLFVKNDNIEFNCPKCGENVHEIKKINSKFFFNPNAQVESAFLECGLQNNKLTYKHKYNIVKYIKFEFFKGEIIIRYRQNNKLIKRVYIFSDFPTSTDTTISHNIKKKLSYLDYDKIKNTSNEQLKNIIEITNEIDDKKIDVSENILNECIKNVIEESKIKEKDIINIENNLSIIDNIYIPFYPSEIAIDKIPCKNYQIAISSPQQIVETVTENYTILDNKIKNKKYRYLINNIFSALIALLFISFIFGIFILKNNIKQLFYILISAIFLIIILYIFMVFYFVKKGGITIKKDKMKTYDNIITDNKRVKIIEEILK